MEIWVKYALEYLNISLSVYQQEQFAVYEQLLLEWNEKFNLTAVRDAEGIRIKHFFDSLTCTKALGDLNGKSLADIGTGAGFPGIPLKIIYPEMNLLLADATGKKVNFCQHVIQTLGLKKSSALQARAEEMGLSREHREKYDAVTARAVARLPILCEYLLPLVKIGGAMLAQKGETAAEELAQSKNAIRILGGKNQSIISVSLPLFEDRRYLVLIQKASATPNNYPRRTGLPSQKPIL